MPGTQVRLELFGLPRLVAGTGAIEASGPDLANALASAVAQYPELANDILSADGTWLNAGYTFVVDGQFVNDPSHPVSADSQILLVSRASGG